MNFVLNLWSLQETGEFKWVDGWPLLWTNWARFEPSSRPGEGCVVVTEYADWDNAACEVQQAYICKYTSRKYWQNY